MAEPLCPRCGLRPAIFKTRADTLCSDCFLNYVGSKASKRMDHYRVGDKSVPKLLLAFSFGPSSLALLHMLDAQMQRQLNKAGKTAYEISVLYVSEKEADPSQLEPVQDLYPRHSYLTCQLNMDNLADIEPNGAGPSNSTERLTASANSDLLAKARERLIAKTAQDLSCSHILFGDSMTRLSERTLAETAKGRGAAIAQLLGDAASIHGVPCYFPLRDLFRWELEQYAQYVASPLLDMANKSSSSKEREGKSQQFTSSKDVSIDELIHQYITDVGQQYPNIVANVARTAARLVEQDIHEDGTCAVCGFSLDTSTAESQKRPGAITEELFNTDSMRLYCHGCARSYTDRR